MANDEAKTDFIIKIVGNASLQLSLAREPSVALEFPIQSASKLGFLIQSIAARDHQGNGLLASQSAVELQEPDWEIGFDDRGRVALGISQGRLAPVHVMLTDEQARSLADGLMKILGSLRVPAGTKPKH